MYSHNYLADMLLKSFKNTWIPGSKKPKARQARQGFLCPRMTAIFIHYYKLFAFRSNTMHRVYLILPKEFFEI